MSTEDQASHEDQSKSLLIAKIYYQGHLKSKEAQDYLELRGLSAQSCRRFEIGYAPNKWRGLVDHFSSHRMRLAAKDAGVITEKQDSKKMLDVFRDRLMFPIHNDAGAIIGYGGRLLPQDEASASNSDYVPAKYINTRETDQFNKSKILYGLHQNRSNIKQSKTAIIVEGYMDVVCMASAGIANGVAPMGTSLTADHIHKLQDENVRSIYLCFDGDKSGQEAALRGALIACANVMPTTDIHIITLPNEHDPDSFIKDNGAQAFQDLIDNADTLPTFISRQCTNDYMHTMEGQASYLAKLEPFIDASSTITRNEIMDIAKSITSLSEKVLYDGKYYDASAAKIDNLTANWSRMIVHNQITHDETLSYTTSGAFNSKPLHELSEQIASSDKPSNHLYDFAMIHGALSEQEVESTLRDIETTVKLQHFESVLQHLVDSPLDESAKQDIKSKMRFG